MVQALIRADDKKTAYFRGRKLHGRSIKVPAGYKGTMSNETIKSNESQNPIQAKICMCR